MSGTNFFTNDFGGNPMMYVNLIWIWGHPEVYILILPAFGVFSEVTATFSGKRLFGYTSMVYATVVITILSYLVWLHHFFTMGSGASVNSFFGITTMIISIPTGAKMFNWLFTMYRGRIRFELPMMWTVAFMLTFVIGGMTGVLLAVPPADFVLHNSLFLVAHFHNVIIGGVVFGMFAGINYWFPKAFGFRLDPFWGKMSFWFWVVGFYFAFMPLYVLGLMGVTRRLRIFDDPSLQIWFIIAAFGALLILLGILCFLVQIAVSIMKREKLRDVTGDPWNGRTLEWSTSSPPPAYNFAFTPVVHDIDAWWDMKQHGYVRPLKGFKPIHMPQNTGAGVILAGFSIGVRLRMIWHIWWLAAAASPRDRDRASPTPSITTAITIFRRTKSSRTEDERTRLLRREGLDHDGMTETLAPDAPTPSFYVAGRACPSRRRQHDARLLDLRDERLSHLRRAVCDLWRPRPQLCRRAPRPRICSNCRWSRSTRRCCCSPPSPMASPCWRWSVTASARRLPGWASPRSSARPSSASNCTNSRV